MDEIEEGTTNVKISTVLAVIKAKSGVCGTSSFATRINKQKILDWIDSNKVP